jgi:hypothetical protein
MECGHRGPVVFEKFLWLYRIQTKASGVGRVLAFDHVADHPIFYSGISFVAFTALEKSGTTRE